MDDITIQEIAKDLEIADLPMESQIEIVKKFSESYIGRLMVELSGNMSDEQREIFDKATTSDEQIKALENIYGQSFESINENIYQNLVQEFKDLMK